MSISGSSGGRGGWGLTRYGGVLGSEPRGIIKKQKEVLPGCGESGVPSVGILMGWGLKLLERFSIEGHSNAHTAGKKIRAISKTKPIASNPAEKKITNVSLRFPWRGPGGGDRTVKKFIESSFHAGG